MALTNQIAAIGDAIREKRNITGEIAFRNMAMEISMIPSSITPGSTIVPAASRYEMTKTLAAIGNAIRAKTGGTETLTLDEMPDAIRSISYFEDEDEEYTDSVGLSYMIYDTLGKKCIITGMGTCTDSVLVIPSQIDGKDVVAIRDGVFDYNETITKVVLNVGVDVWSSAFRACPNLETVVIGKTKSTSSSSSPSGIEIYESAFAGCSKLHTVIINRPVLSFGNNAFSGCPKLKTIRVWDIYDFCRISFGNMYANPLCACPGESVLYNKGLPLTELVSNDIDSVRGLRKTPNYINHYAFYKYAPLQKISMQVYESVCAYAFAECPNLTDVTIVASNILEHAFENCPNLTTLTLRAGHLGSYSFAYCPKLSGTLTLPVGEMAYYAFTGAGIEHLVIKGGTYYIYYGAFYNCPNLKTVTCLDNVGYMSYQYSGASHQHNTFEACPNLTDIYVPWIEGDVYGAPWGATDATIHYNHTA